MEFGRLSLINTMKFLKVSTSTYKSFRNSRKEVPEILEIGRSLFVYVAAHARKSGHSLPPPLQFSLAFSTFLKTFNEQHIDSKISSLEEKLEFRRIELFQLDVSAAALESGKEDWDRFEVQDYVLLLDIKVQLTNKLEKENIV